MSVSGNNSTRSAGYLLLRACQVFAVLLICVVSPVQAETPTGKHRVDDLYYGQALYQFFQRNELAAITGLMTATARPARAGSQIDEARLLLADLYYSYGLHEESRSLFAQLLNAKVSDSIQNRIWFNLARLRYEQGYYDHARELLSLINDQLPDNIEAERKYLLSNLYLGSGDYEQAAKLSGQIDPTSIWQAYAHYNLGVALIEDEGLERGGDILDQLGQMESGNDELLALRDLANLSLALKQLRLGHAEPALQSLLRIRLEGPLSNQALLASGWAWYRLQQFDKSLLPWQLLLRRNAVDSATQEAILAIPANYAEVGKDRLAIRYYELAAKQFDLQLESLQDAIQSISANELIDSLRNSALLEDRSDLQRQPPSSAVTPQLHLLLASKGFHREIKHYQELLDIRESLSNWDSSFATLELMLGERSQAFAERLPALQQSSSFDQYEKLSLQRDRLATQIEAIESSKDYQALAQVDELEHLERLQRVADSIDRLGAQRNTEDQQEMLRVLSGLMNYRLATDYPRRIWQSKKQLIHLDRALAKADERVAGLGRITDRTQLDLNQFRDRLSGQSEKIDGLRLRVTDLLNQQEQQINRLAVDAIRIQQEHVRKLMLNARFELARIYDKLAVAN